jgi:hypothetical protein
MVVGIQVGLENKDSRGYTSYMTFPSLRSLGNDGDMYPADPQPCTTHNVYTSHTSYQRAELTCIHAPSQVCMHTWLPSVKGQISSSNFDVAFGNGALGCCQEVKGVVQFDATKYVIGS